ncbi:hypothetical protein AGMMS4952_21770 [Spirochaetia bacterium]|nr:hypothetical protein AGMMS4952_21770 [Spirochaetia bacterium]
MEEIHIVACKTLKPEIDMVMHAQGCDYPIAWIDSGKHVWPDKLRICIQETIDVIPPAYKTILLVFGFCGNAMVGIKAGEHQLVLPRAADCIPLFLGSQKKREEYGVATVFFTEGYLHSETNFITDYENYQKKYGNKRSLWVLKEMMKHYKNIAVIDTGAFDPPDVVTEVEPYAKILEIPVSLIPGNLRLIDALLSGNWDNGEFLVIPSEGVISFEDSLLKEGVSSQAAPV